MRAAKNAVVCLALASCLGACTLEEVSGPGPGGQEVRRIPSDEPGYDDRLDALGIICESTLVVSGLRTATEPQPPDVFGCWPVGIWTVTATVDFQGCDPQEPIDGEFVYEVVRDEDSNTSVAYVPEPGNERLNLKITSAGDGLCHANFEHFGMFGSNEVVLTLQPTLQEDGTLLGIGSFAVWEEDPF